MYFPASSALTAYWCPTRTWPSDRPSSELRASRSGGEGPEVIGAALSLLLAVSGRRVLDDLDGPGVAALSAAI